MVKLRHPGTFAGVIAKVIETIGYEAVCAEIEVGRSELYRWSDEDCPKLPRLDQARRLDALAARHGLGTPLTDALAAKLAEAERPAHEPRDPLEAVTETMREFAEGVTAFHEAHAHPTPAARARARKELAEAEAAVAMLRRDLDAIDGAAEVAGGQTLRMVGADRHG